MVANGIYWRRIATVGAVKNCGVLASAVFCTQPCLHSHTVIVHQQPWARRERVLEALVSVATRRTRCAVDAGGGHSTFRRAHARPAGSQQLASVNVRACQHGMMDCRGFAQQETTWGASDVPWRLGRSRSCWCTLLVPANHAHVVGTLQSIDMGSGRCRPLLYEA